VRAPTHIAFAELLYLVLVSSTGMGLSALGAAGAALASVAPDVDSGDTTAGRLLPSLAHYLETRFGHRTLTHSLCAICALAFFALPLLMVDSTVYFCVILGFSSHPVLDSMTITGVELFYPFSRVRCVFPMEVKHPYRYRVRSGSRTDSALAIACLVLCAPAFLIARAGHPHMIRAVQRDIGSAVREFRELEHSCTVYAEVQARHILSGQELRGTFEILGAADERTLLVLDSSGTTRSVGARQKAEFLAEEILCRKGAPITASSREYDMAGRLLGELLTGESFGRVLLFGELELEDAPAGAIDPPWATPVRWRGSTLVLTSARPEELRKLGLSGAMVRHGSARILIRGSSGVPEIPSPSARWIRLELPGKNFRVRCRKGDLVRGDSVLAYSDRFDEIRAETSAIRLEQESRELEDEADLAESQGQISRALANLLEDSLALAHQMMTVQEGFGPQSLLEGAIQRFARRKETLRALFTQEVFCRSRRLLRRKRITARLARLEEGMDRTILRAPGPAVVHSITITEGRLTIHLERR